MTLSSNQSIHSPRQIPKRVLILGATGMVGRAWVEKLESNKIRYRAVSRPEFDLMDPISISECITEEYDLVVNAAAWTDVDGAESEETCATRANGESLAEIAQLCKDIDATLITYSTDYVFSGDGDAPYPTDAPNDPVNAYGRSKLVGEKTLSASTSSHILIRTSWVYAPWGNNFVRTIWNLAKTRDELQVVNDQQGRPTSAQQLAHNSFNLYLKGAQGVWHLSDDGECTWFDLATQIAKRSNPQCNVNPCSSDQYPRPAKRPAYSTLDISESMKLVGTIKNWQDCAAAVCNALIDAEAQTSSTN